MSQLISKNEMSKKYYAVLCGRPQEDSAVLRDLLFKDSSKNKSYVVKRMRKGVKEASLEYIVADSVQNDAGVLTLVKVKLHTGRTHQIRVQFSSRNLPLLGDGRYGGKSKDCDISLWSAEISFISPFDGQRMTFHASPPGVYPWDLFKIQ